MVGCKICDPQQLPVLPISFPAHEVRSGHQNQLWCVWTQAMKAPNSVEWCSKIGCFFRPTNKNHQGQLQTEKPSCLWIKNHGPFGSAIILGLRWWRVSAFCLGVSHVYIAILVGILVSRVWPFLVRFAPWKLTTTKFCPYFQTSFPIETTFVAEVSTVPSQNQAPAAPGFPVTSLIRQALFFRSCQLQLSSGRAERRQPGVGWWLARRTHQNTYIYCIYIYVYMYIYLYTYIHVIIYTYILVIFKWPQSMNWESR